ncbi:hypothetical protein P7C71_g2243, partial [Lecanoromycetidae sp. Uapishka_2]
MDPQTSTLNPSRLTDIIEDVVDNKLSRLENLLLEGKNRQDFKLSALEATLLAMSGDQAARDEKAEKASKARTRKEKRERETEREDLVEAIRHMALEEEEKGSRIEEPVLLKDCVGRSFVFPFEECRGWKRFAELVRQAFDPIEFLGPHVNDGHYDILDPKGRVILPSVWDAVVEPGWQVSMHMWPMNQDQIEDKRGRLEGRIENTSPPRLRVDGRNGLRGRIDESEIVVINDEGSHSGADDTGGRRHRDYDSDEDIVQDEEEHVRHCGANKKWPARKTPSRPDVDEKKVDDSVTSVPESRDPGCIFDQIESSHLADNAKIGPSVLEQRSFNRRIRKVEKQLFAEKELTATLEEALVDFETQNSKAKAEAQMWKEKYNVAETALAKVSRQNAGICNREIMGSGQREVGGTDSTVDRNSGLVVPQGGLLTNLTDDECCEEIDDWDDATVED